MTFPVFQQAVIPAAGLTYEITSADLTLNFAETPTATEVQTYFNTLGDTSFNDNIIYTSPAGIEHPFTVGTLVDNSLKVFKTPIDRIEFVDLPLSTTVAPGTRVAATVADEFRHFIRVDPGTYAEEAIGGAGAGGGAGGDQADWAATVGQPGHILNKPSISGVAVFDTTFGDGAAVTFTLPHALGTDVFTTEVSVVATGEVFLVPVSKDATNITIGPFETAPTTNQYRITTG